MAENDFSYYKKLNDDSKVALIELRDKLVAKFEKEIGIPDCCFELDFASREGNDRRIIRHICQGSEANAMNFKASNGLKLCYLIDGYINQICSKNLFGPYLFARCVVELAAFCHYVSSELNMIYEKADNTWKSKGEEFFKFILRARYATSDTGKNYALSKANISNNIKKPISISNCIDRMDKTGEHKGIKDKYAKLCDYVHHNNSSQFLASHGAVASNNFRNEYGNIVALQKDGAFSVYKYGSFNKLEIVIRETIDDMVTYANSVQLSLESLPPYPFSSEFILRKTDGDGVYTSISHTQNHKRSPMGKCERNDPCPCGSGKKFKKCCYMSVN